jgi:hypothetical protein
LEKVYNFINHIDSGKQEQLKAATTAEQIKNSRKNVKIERLDWEGSDEFFELLGGKKEIKSAVEGGDDTKVSQISEVKYIFLIFID